MISTKKTVKISHTILEELTETYEPKFPTVIALTDKDVRLIKETYLTAVRSADYKTLSLLREKVETILQTNSEFYDKQFIETVLKDYNYYTQSM